MSRMVDSKVTTMFRNLLSAFSEDDVLAGVTRDFRAMVQLASDMVAMAGKCYWSPDNVVSIDDCCREEDARMNELQRAVRRAVILHLATSDKADVPYSLLLMSLVKDVERVGDYAKNLVKVPKLVGQVGKALPEGELCDELRQFARQVEALAAQAPRIYDEADKDAAAKLTAEGKARANRCDDLLRRIAASEYDAATVTRLTLTLRFYKRIQGHLLNLVSSMLVPLDQLDSYEPDVAPI